MLGSFAGCRRALRVTCVHAGVIQSASIVGGEGGGLREDPLFMGGEGDTKGLPPIYLGAC